jgi:predicted nicotinamide N-methyase
MSFLSCEDDGVCLQQEDPLRKTIFLRVDVQNPPSNTNVAPLILRVQSNASLKDIHTKIKDAIEQALKQKLTSGFHVEVYLLHQQEFAPLSDVSQLGARARLNIILNEPKEKESFLALPSKIFDIDLEKGEFKVLNQVIHIGEVGNSGKGTGLTTWDGSVVLAKYLEYSLTDEFKNKRVVELGSGTGLVGICTALLGAKEVILTDLEYTMENLARNAARNRHTHGLTSLNTKVLDWFNPPENLGDVDLILASDVVWVEDLIPPFVRTLYTLSVHSSRPTSILMSYQKRSIVSDQILFHQLQLHGFQVDLIPHEQLHPEYVSDRIDVYRIYYYTSNKQPKKRNTIDEYDKYTVS